MELSFGTGLRQTQSLALSMRLSPLLHQQILQKALALRLALIESLRNERYEPEGECPQCSRKLSAVEIIQGFSRDPNDFTTRCTCCGRRFEPELVCLMGAGKIRLRFYCDCQVLGMLAGKETLPPEQFARDHPSIYRSAIVHHGGIRQAFIRIGIHYPFEEIADWKNKIKPFLGRLPDTVIAGSAGVSVKEIRAIRKKLRIERFCVRKLIDEDI